MDEVVVPVGGDDSGLDGLGGLAVSLRALGVSHLLGELGSEDHGVSGGQFVPEQVGGSKVGYKGLLMGIFKYLISSQRSQVWVV